VSWTLDGNAADCNSSIKLQHDTYRASGLEGSTHTLLVMYIIITTGQVGVHKRYVTVFQCETQLSGEVTMGYHLLIFVLIKLCYIRACKTLQ
jgi:hypothetical protein